MKCPQCGVNVQRLRYFHVDGKLVGGCRLCMSRIRPESTISTEKRHYQGNGYDFTASPAHIDHVKHRRISPDDNRSVYQCRK